MSVERGGRTDTRQRRMFQKLGSDVLGTLDLLQGSGIFLDTGSGTISVLLGPTPGLAFTTGLVVDLRDTDPGLTIDATGLGVLLGSTPGLTTTDGLKILLATTSGLNTTSGLTIDLRDTDPGLEVVATGLGILLGTNPGLTNVSGLAISLGATPGLTTVGGLAVVVDTSFGLSLNASGIRIDLATDSGLEFSGGDLRVKIKAAGGITRDSNGLSVTTATASGTYTPTATTVANLDSTPTPGVFTYQQIGSIVMVSGRVSVDPTLAATTTTFDLTLPVGGNFVAADNASGFAGDTIVENGAVAANVGAATVRVTFTSVGVTAHDKRILFQYVAQ